METAEKDQPFIWCLVANMTSEPHPEGLGGEMRLGSKRLAPGAKVYVFRGQWSDGGEKKRILARHRGGGPHLMEIIVSTKWLVNWRVQKVYHPFIVRRMTEWEGMGWDGTEDSRLQAEEAAAYFNNGGDGIGPFAAARRFKDGNKERPDQSGG